MSQMHKTPLESYRKKPPTDLYRPAHDHDGVMQRAVRLLHELLGTASQDDGARLGLRAALEEVVPARGGVGGVCVWDD